jgi:hypothetical protein
MVVLQTITIIYFLTSQKSFFQNLDSDRCATRCSSVSNTYDCCECQATGNFIDDTEKFNRKFRYCMCGKGYKDYCFKPVTNFLLSQ